MFYNNWCIPTTLLTGITSTLQSMNVLTRGRAIGPPNPAPCMFVNFFVLRLPGVLAT